MRQARGEGAAWLAWRRRPSMTGASGSCGRCFAFQPCRAARHLLATGIAWFDDPTNVDSKYERARLRLWRRLVPSASRSHFRPASIADAARQRWNSANLPPSDPNACPACGSWLIAIDRSFRQRDDRDAAVYVLRILLAAAGGSEQLPDLARAAALFGRLRAALSARRCRARRSMRGATRSSSGGKIVACRARTAAGGIWDGRFRIGPMPDGATVAPLGLAYASALLARHQEADVDRRSAEPDACSVGC